MTRTGSTVAMLIVVLAASACGGARDSSEVGADETGAGDGGRYTGAIWTLVAVQGASPSITGYNVQAGFSAFAPNIEFLYPVTTPDTGCSCTHGIGIGDPGPEEVSAGTITVTAADGGPVLAALMPTTSTTHVYGGTPASGWAPGEVLAVSAQGQPDQVKAFSTRLQTAAPFSAVMPALGAAPVTILRGMDFSVSWTPEAKDHEIVSLSITQLTSASAVQCTCFGPESTGAITLPAGSLADFAPSSSASSDATSATVYMTRWVVSPFLTETATVYLIGQASLSGSAEFQ
jgi:hypothetical protein